MTSRAAAIAASCLLLLVSTSRLRAAGPQFWRVEGSRGFLDAELHELAVDSLGRLRLGIAPRLVHDPVAPSGWAVARDPQGALYLGTGNDGRVVRVQGGRGAVLFDADELEVHALVVAGDGAVYAGTSPDGAVYRIETTGKATRFFDPEEKYIWALALDPAGRLLVATGAAGRVYQVSQDGTARVLLTSSDTHILSLALDPRGRVLAGSAPEGIVYRVDPAGDVTVLLDSAFREIRSLDASEDGVVYAAAIEPRTSDAAPRPPAPAAPATAPAGSLLVPEVTVSESFVVVAPAGSPPLPTTTAEVAAAGPPKGAILRISEAGDLDTLWTSTDDVPYAVLRSGDGLLVGTGNKGKLYRVTREREWTLVASLAAEQVTALAAGDGDAAFAVTSNPARLYQLDRTLAARGTFLSKVKDAEAPARWGAIRFEGRTPAGSAVELQARSGNTEQPDATWTDWWNPGARDAGQGRRARFLQLRATLSASNGASPVIEALEAAYLQRNLPPEVKAITVHPAGEVFQKPMSVSGDPEILGLDPAPRGDHADASRTAGGTPPAISFSRKMYERGIRTLSWQGEDPNGDSLLYDVQYRAVGDDRWRSLRKGLAEPVFAWDTSTVPNGRYLVRIIASDTPDNPPALALTGSLASSSFEVDNTPPSITGALDGSHKNRIRVVVRDDSPVAKLEISVDGGRWEEVHPRDGIADSSEEQYDIVVPQTAAPGPRAVMLRAGDVLGNLATVRFDVP